MVSIRFHGYLTNELKRAEYKLDVKSVAEALHAVNILNNNRLFQHLSSNQIAGYRVIIDGKTFTPENKLNPNNPESIETIKNSELSLRRSRIKTIDIVPVLDFAGSDALSILSIIAGVLLIAVAIFIPGAQPALIVAGLTLIAAGTLNLLTKPPKFEDFREVETGGRTSYLFSGPQNVVGEGGPVPIGYGRLIVGSQTISASYDIYNIPVADVSFQSNTDNLLFAVNCGSRVAVDRFQADGYNFAYTTAYHLVPIDLTGVTDPAPEEVYKSVMEENLARTAPDLNYFDYKFDFGIEYSNRPIFYRFHFSENEVGMNVGGRFFDVVVNGVTIVSALDVRSAAGAIRKAYIIEGNATLDGVGKLRINAANVGGSQRPLSLINGIEVYLT